MPGSGEARRDGAAVMRQDQTRWCDPAIRLPRRSEWIGGAGAGVVLLLADVARDHGVIVLGIRTPSAAVVGVVAELGWPDVEGAVRPSRSRGAGQEAAVSRER